MTTIIKFKKEGDRFLVDCWADSGCACSAYFRNELAPLKCKSAGLSSLNK